MISSSILILAAGTALVIIGLVIAIATGRIYNMLVGQKNLSQNSFSQIEIQLKRRYDLIPNLVECVKSYVKHERETLEAVIAARNQASASLTSMNHQLTNTNGMHNLVQAEGILGGALGRMSCVIESYPELKANEVVSQLTEELSSTENRIAFARQVYNDCAMTFNIQRQSFPTVLFAASFGFADDLEMLEFENSAEIQAAPKVAMA